MNWHDAQTFWSMGGYGLYVWGAFGGVALVLMAENLSLAWRLRAARLAAGTVNAVDALQEEDA